MADDLRADLYQLLAQAGQRPRLGRLRHRQCAHEIAEVVRQGMKLKAHRVGREGAARQPRPLDRVLAFLDPLLARAASIMEATMPLGERARLLTMKPTRGYSSPGCHSTLATTWRDLFHRSPEGIVAFYNQRGTCEQWIKGRQETRSSGRGCRAAPSRPTRCAFSFRLLPTISATLCGRWRCRRQRSRGR